MPAYEMAPDRQVNAVASLFRGTRTAFWRGLTSELWRACRQALPSVYPCAGLPPCLRRAPAYLQLMTSTFITGQVVAVDGGVMLDK
ncbi:hypothetical protein B0I32_14052 [Nonomuraea fuscirosea]|uniref:Enoyl-ACP reductase-like protein n=1 Tax=Nonomuraea fuscirosea TaxID=1291556 RepID=A0A2T0LXT4_9ACTN|nr:hypothetical protein B0I32_14052 [Nonomuraea fuscirosea]